MSSKSCSGQLNMSLAGVPRLFLLNTGFFSSILLYLAAVSSHLSTSYSFNFSFVCSLEVKVRTTQTHPLFEQPRPPRFACIEILCMRVNALTSLSSQTTVCMPFQHSPGTWSLGNTHTVLSWCPALQTISCSKANNTILYCKNTQSHNTL